MRPFLTPALRRLHRDTGVIQLGVDPTRAVLLEFDDSRIARLIDLLDGSRTRQELHQAAHKLGLSAESVDQLLAELTTAGILRAGLPSHLPPSARARLLPEGKALALRGEPTEILRHRWSATVLITGDDRLAVPIAATLAAAGIGRVHTSLTGIAGAEDAVLGGVLPADSGRSRALAAADAVRRVAPEHVVRQARPNTPPTLAIIVGHDPRPPMLTALTHARHRVPHMLVTVREGHVGVGPMIRPGETACLGCLDRYRTERDPHWPVLHAQLATSPVRSEACEVGLAVLASGYATIQALLQLDGGTPEILDTTVEWSPDGSRRQRRWLRHPSCECGLERAAR